jgi:hypothetical protein
VGGDLSVGQFPPMPPFNNNVQLSGSLVVVHKADIPERDGHVFAAYVRFHSRHNRLKGDRRDRCRNQHTGSDFLILEN